MEQVTAYNMQVGSLVKNTTFDRLLTVCKIQEEKHGDFIHRVHILKAMDNDQRYILTFVNGNNDFPFYFIISQ